MFTKQDLVNIKSLGCDVIRLPINLHHMTGGAPDYTVDPLFFYFLDQIVDWCEELQIHLILDNHTGDVDANGNTDVNIDTVLVPVWTQMAEHYQERSDISLLRNPQRAARDRGCAVGPDSAGGHERHSGRGPRAYDRGHPGELGQLQQSGEPALSTGTPI